jgi:O-antigen/teichoic acid export membrane protein
LTSLLLLGVVVSPAETLLLYVAAVAIAYLVGVVLLNMVTERVWGSGAFVAPSPGWWQQAIPLTLISGSGVVIANLPILVISALTGPAEAGLFAVAFRAATVQALGLAAINTVVGPMIARLTAGSDREGLQGVLTRSARLSFLLTAALAALMVVFRDELLSLFGGEFKDAAIPLVILSAGQVVNAACGSVGTLFIMSNETRYAVGGFAIGAVTTFALLILLVPPLGVTGAATATATGIAVWNLGLVSIAWSRKRVDPTILGRTWRDHYGTV